MKEKFENLKEKQYLLIRIIVFVAIFVLGIVLRTLGFPDKQLMAVPVCVTGVIDAIIGLKKRKEYNCWLHCVFVGVSFVIVAIGMLYNV